MREPALAVVGQDDYIPVGDHPLVVRELVEQNLVTRRGLEVDPQHLLLPSDHAQLHRGGDVTVVVQCRVNAGFFQKLRECTPRLVVPDNREQRHVRTQRCSVRRGVRGSTGRFLGAIRLDLDDLHGRFVGNAVHLAVPVAVEHHVAHYEDARLVQLRENQIFRFHPPALTAARPIG